MCHKDTSPNKKYHETRTYSPEKFCNSAQHWDGKATRK